MSDQWITVPVEPTLEMIRAEAAEKRAAESEANARLAIDRMVKAEMRAEAAEADLKIADDALHDMDEKLLRAYTKLRAVGELPEQWRKADRQHIGLPDPWISKYADELEAVLKGDA